MFPKAAIVTMKQTYHLNNFIMKKLSVKHEIKF